MSFWCNVAAGQHTPKSTLESSEPRNVILAPALTRACHGAATVAATVAATAAATVAATVAATAAATAAATVAATVAATAAATGRGGGFTTNLAVDQADGAAGRRHFAGWGSAP